MVVVVVVCVCGGGGGDSSLGCTKSSAFIAAFVVGCTACREAM